MCGCSDERRLEIAMFFLLYFLCYSTPPLSLFLPLSHLLNSLLFFSYLPHHFSSISSLFHTNSSLFSISRLRLTSWHLNTYVQNFEYTFRFPGISFSLASQQRRFFMERSCRHSQMTVKPIHNTKTVSDFMEDAWNVERHKGGTTSIKISV